MIYITLAEAKDHCRAKDFNDDDAYIAGLVDLVEELVKSEISGTFTGEGTITTAGVVALVGVGTNFADFAVGDTIKVEGETDRVIATITTDLALTVTVAFTTTASGLTWEVDTGLPLVGGLLNIELKQAMLLMIAHFYNVREPVLIGVGSAKIPYGFDFLIAKHKNYTIA